MNNNLIQTITLSSSSISNSVLIFLVVMGSVLILLLSIATLYLIISLRRKTIVLKKVDYLIEDLTYKSESLNVTVETINKVSNYLLSLDAVTQNGFKSAIKLLAENKNYIYSITEKIKTGVEEREALDKKKSKKTKPSSKTTVKKIAKNKPINKKNTKSKKD